MARHKAKPSAKGKAPKNKRVPAAAKKPAVEEEAARDSEDTLLHSPQLLTLNPTQHPKQRAKKMTATPQPLTIKTNLSGPARKRAKKTAILTWMGKRRMVC